MIPNKSNFKFQELTPITGVKPYVIRFWETEFPEIAPITGDSGVKLYARKDVEAILKIKKLLFEEKLSIPEAKSRMSVEVLELPSEDVERSSSKTSSVHREILENSLHLIREIKAKKGW
jgi:DNA-binding transcriptional MerR regulator